MNELALSLLIPTNVVAWAASVLFIASIFYRRSKDVPNLQSCLLFIGWQLSLFACVLEIIWACSYMGSPGAWRADKMWIDGAIAPLTRALVLTAVIVLVKGKSHQYTVPQQPKIIFFLIISVIDILFLGGLVGYFLGYDISK